MKKTSLVLAAALSCIALSAAAGGSHGAQGSNGAAGGGGGGGGAGLGVGIATARAGARATNTSRIGIATNVGLGVTTGANTAAGGIATGGSIGSGAVQIGSTTYEAAASPSFAPPAHGPLRSCRLYAGAGGASRDGSGSAGIPIGNDQICLTDAAHELMDRLNTRRANTFSDEDYLRAACKVEGMAETRACKDLEGRSTASTPQAMAYTSN